MMIYGNCIFVSNERKYVLILSVVRGGRSLFCEGLIYIRKFVKKVELGY